MTILILDIKLFLLISMIIQQKLINYQIFKSKYKFLRLIQLQITNIIIVFMDSQLIKKMFQNNFFIILIKKKFKIIY